ncbi:hypothetical protein BJX63DRAFT_445164 [Aspergillus granulosus]|uniref:Nucleoporin Nup159/Nup146 N-terminal domain-containing protein n=1 Tax=Aspergillus granulosus TaxID=176169 RepID=A0ABR4H2K2_9EURO
MGNSNPAGSIPTELGPELPDILAEEVGFKGVSGDSNVQLLSTPWPADALPAPTSTLLAVAATKGIVVGAGPSTLSIASTQSVRAAISADTGKDKVKTKPFQPQATISLPGRPTHIAFASTDTALVLATENGSHLSIFETGTLLQPNVQPALSIPTNGATFRFIAPNPAQGEESHASLVALVTTAGELLIADLKAGNLLSGSNGNILKSGVSSVCWSKKGKQLVAGLVDGTGYQMSPDGAQKDLIPRPPDLTDPCHVSSIAWLENDVFLMIYTPNAEEDDMGMTPSSSYYIITKRKQAPFLVQKLPELASPFGYKRAPAYQFISWLRDYKPHLKDVLIVSSTASADVGLITRSDHPLSSEDNAKATVGQFVTTEVNDDAKKASVPLKDSVDETSVIGLAVDLSSSETVVAPIQGADIDESSTPLPNLLLLNHEGILCSWWFIYNDSIRQKIPYHGLASVGPQQQAVSQPQITQPQTMAQPAFGQTGFGSSASPSAPALAAPAFGKPSAPAFGGPSALGRPSQPSFGQPSFGTPAFGGPTTLGSVAPQFGKSGFGQPSTPGKGFSSFSIAGATSSGGFGSFAGGGGFGSLAASKPSEGSPFSQVTGESPFARTSGASVFGGQTDNNTAFTSQKTEVSKGVFGTGSGGFVLGSTFKGDGTAVNDAPKPEKSSGLFSFNSSFDDMVSTPSKPSPPTEAMDDMEDTTVPQQNIPEDKSSAPSLFSAPSKPSSGTSIFSSFGSQTQTAQPFGPAPTTKSPFSLFGNTTTENKLSSPSSTPSEKTAIASPPLTQAKSPEPETTHVTPIPEAPLPPDPTSRAAYGPGDTSASSNVSKNFSIKPKEEKPKRVEEAPLPPDFTKPSMSFMKGPPPIPGGSDADESEKNLHEADESEFEDSGEDITHELSQPETNALSIKSSPESSFDDKQGDESPARSLFGQQQPRRLFGEINNPLFPQPSHAHGSPRSPSPVRPGRARKGFPGLENIRSVSAPHKPGDALAARKASLSELAKRESKLKLESKQPPAQPAAQALEEPLSDDEDERLRADLSRPLEPVPTLDPFLPHQDYTGQTAKPGIPGQIEKLYRDINSMVDTLGINARSLSSFLLYQQETPDSEWVNILKGDHPADILDEKPLLRQIEDLEDVVAVLIRSLEEQQVQGVEEKLESCREILGKDILTLRSQCASIRKTLDAHTDPTAILSAPLSAEQASLQQDLRAFSADIQAKLADLESAVSLLRARIADAPRAEGSRQTTRRPTVEAVTSTIATMMNMVESKSGDIDVLEVQLKKLGIDTSATPSSREGSPFATPRKGLGKLPTTPGSRGSLDGAVPFYNTPESATRGLNFRSSVNGSAKGSRLRAMETSADFGNKRESAQWKAKMQRKQHILSNLKKAIDEKKSKVRSVDDL